MQRILPARGTRGRVIPVALALCLLAAPGCFVFEEMDNAGKPPKSAGAPAAKTAAAPSETGGSARAKLQAYYNRKPRQRPEHDPADPIVRCSSGGKLQFMRKQECELRGGEVEG